MAFVAIVYLPQFVLWLAMKKNVLKEKLRMGKPCVGLFATIPSPSIVELAAVAGFDYVIIDLEHGVIDYETMENMVRAADVHGLTAVVRVPESFEDAVLKALEAGAHGVEIPHIGSAAEAEKAVKAVKYAPEGMRGVSPYTRAAWYTSIPPREHFAVSNRETMVVLQIEGVEGVENMEAIASVKGVDVLFVGPYDLSQALGVPGDVDNEKVLAALKKLVQICMQKGVSAGSFAPTVEKARQLISQGVKYVAYSVDTGIIYKGFKQAVDEILVKS